MGLSRRVFHGEAASAPVERLEDERHRLLSIIVIYNPRDVFNCDETALLYCLVPNCGLALEDMPGVKLDKKRITYLLCTNMDGSDKLPPLIIGRARKPRCFQGYIAAELGHYYFYNGKAWMTHLIWKKFLAHLNEDMRRQGRHILLLCDNAPSHKHNPADYPHVRVEFLAPNLTAWIQPLDGGIIASFKAQHRRRFVRFAPDQDNQGVADMYKVDQLQAMKMAHDAWQAVTPQTIRNRWDHVGLVPSYSDRTPATDDQTLFAQPQVYAPTYQGYVHLSNTHMVLLSLSLYIKGTLLS